MIEIKTKIHDRFSIEFKVGFVAREKEAKNDFHLAMWLFLPDSLDINPSTYSKQDFYRDVKSNVRLITPIFRLEELPGRPLGKLLEVSSAFALSPSDAARVSYEYHIKMFSAILKSSLRDEVSVMTPERIASLRKVLDGFGQIRSTLSASPASDDAVPILECCEEFICNSMSRYLTRIAGTYRSEDLRLLLKEIDAVREKFGYSTVRPGDEASNAEFVHRRSVLKKIVERQLYLRVPKKRDGILAEQVYYSLAAGLAMIFATIVAWLFQKSFGNLTWPLFIALIISYMMKDRIKELMRFRFAHKMKGKYYDNKAEMSLGQRRIGSLKEAFDFIPDSRVPEEVRRIRSEKPFFKADALARDEKVMLYRKSVHLDREALEDGMEYEFAGINDIIRLQVESFLRKMDNPVQSVTYLDSDGNPVETTASRDYHINVVMQYRHEDVTDWKHFRINLSRDGIKGIEEL